MVSLIKFTTILMASSIWTLICDIVFLSRIVTVWLMLVSESTVIKNGIPISSDEKYFLPIETFLLLIWYRIFDFIASFSNLFRYLSVIVLLINVVILTCLKQSLGFKANTVLFV